MLQFNESIGSLMHTVCVDVTDEGLEQLEMEPGSQQSAPVWDGKTRLVIPAFPTGPRPAAGHVHTPDDVQWHPERKLPLYPIPDELQEEIDALDRSPSFNPWLTRDNFCERMHKLLYIEEAAQVKNFRRYDLAEAELHAVQNGDELWYRLAVPGLAERRPSILKSDSVYVWVPGTVDVEYEGFVAEVQRDGVLLQLNPSFKERTDGTPAFNVRFTFPRIQMRRMHMAIDTVDLDTTWPTHKLLTDAPVVATPNWSLAKWTPNEGQKEAVERILALARQPQQRHFLLRGAFGTGKTSTLCQAVVQLLHTPMPAGRACRILLCTECNAAADLYITLLEQHGLKPDQLLRCYQVGWLLATRRSPTHVQLLTFHPLVSPGASASGYRAQGRVAILRKAL